jgi:hypothetical protein
MRLLFFCASRNSVSEGRDKGEKKEKKREREESKGETEVIMLFAVKD